MKRAQPTEGYMPALGKRQRGRRSTSPDRPPAHELKVWPAYFEAISDGRKRCDIRRDDRGFELGQDLQLQEWDPTTGQYTGRALRARISHLDRPEANRAWERLDLPPDVVVLSLADVRSVPFQA